MAIQVNGTQVIGNSRELTNIASVDATTAAAITAAGVGGGGSLDITASGTLADGRAVLLKTDGTVEPVGGTSQVLGTSAQLISGTGRLAGCYSPNDNKIIVVYNDDSPGGSHYPTAQVGTISGSSISFGSKVVLFSSAVYVNFDICWQNTTNKAVFVGWPNGGTYMKYGFGTISGTSSTWTSFANTVGNNGGEHVAVVEMGGTNNVVFSDKTGNSPPSINGYAVIADTSQSSPGTHGSTNISTQWPQGMKVGYNPDTSTILVSWWDTYNGGDRMRMSSGSYSSGLTFSVSGNVSQGNSFRSALYIVYDSTAERNVMQYDDSANYILVIEANGSSITLGTPITMPYTSYYQSRPGYSADLGKCVAQSTNSSGTYAHILTIDPVANTVSASTAVTTFSTPSGTLDTVYASGSGPVFALLRKKNLSGYDAGDTNVYYPPSTNLSADNFLGLSDGSYTNGQTATVSIVGGVNDGQSGMTPGTTQYVQDDGTISSTSSSVAAGLAISATEVLVKG